jgi:anti-sigma factor ChrR (cupin superfamily)
MSSTVPATDPALDAELVARIDAALAPEPLPAAAHERVKRRLLQRIAADNTPQHLTHPPGPEGWQPFGAGVQIKVLYEEGGVMSYLLRLAAGAALPPHRHPVDEECVVLEGEVQIGTLRVGAGGFHLGRKNLLHDALRSDGGALIFLRGAVPEARLVL